MTMRSNLIRALLIMLGAAAAVGESAPTYATDTAEMITLNPQTLKFRADPWLAQLCVCGGASR